MSRKQKYAAFTGIVVTIVYWGFYNWIAYGIDVIPPAKVLAAFMYIFFTLPAISITYENTSNK
jgi:hypothetical protein